MGQSSVFHYDPVTRSGALQLGQGRWAGTSWTVKLYACANPSCGCSKIDLECTPDGSVSGSSHPSFFFWLDVEKQELDLGGDPAPSAEFLAFGRAVVSEMGEADWRTLSDCLREFKNGERLRSTGMEGAFPKEVLSGEVSMVGYAEIFPRAEDLRFELDSVRWLADDQYCVNPECRCREALLSFIRLPDGAPTEHFPDAPAVFYDYKRAGLTPANEPPDQPSLAALVRGLREGCPGLDLQLARRHREMRTLFRQALQKGAKEESGRLAGAASESSGLRDPALVQQARSAKAGRNDPCPCGSGRKFKKCCGS